MKPRWFDTFMLRDELDMLEVRLRELEGKPVAAHVLVEAAADHRGNPKPLHYAENKKRFAPWAGRIIHVVADLPDTPDPWAREHAQRCHVWKALDDAGARPDDVVNFADVDEFPPDEAFGRLPEPALAHQQRLMMYAVDWEHPGSPMRCSVTARLGWARNIGACFRCGKPGCATMVRDAREGYPAVEGGWHITWLGGIEGQHAKLSSTCHTELSAQEHDNLWSGRCYDGLHHTGSMRMVPRDVDETWPEMIYERKCPANWFRPRPDQEEAATRSRRRSSFLPCHPASR